MAGFAALRSEYATLWRSMVIKPSRQAEFDATAKRLMRGMSRYKQVSAATGVPPALIAILHERESGADFDTYLGNGQSIHRVTTIVPTGRGPFRNFEEGAIDALAIDGLSKVQGWSIEKALYYAEKFNGFGYRNKGLRSPYLWGGTNHQQPGKYVRDGVFDPNVMDTQLGAAGVLFCLGRLDPSVGIPVETPDPNAPIAVPEPVQPRTAPSAPSPVSGTGESPEAPTKPATVISGGVGALALLGGAMAYVLDNPWLLAAIAVAAVVIIAVVHWVHRRG